MVQAEQISRRIAGEPISNRLVSLSDPDARPIGKGKQGKPTEWPTEFVYVVQLCEVTASTKPGQRDLLPPASLPGSPNENDLLPQTVAEFSGLGIQPRESPSTDSFGHLQADEQLVPIAPARTFIAAARSPGGRAAPSAAWPATGSAPRCISHLKRRYGLRRTRLKGPRIWTGWATFAY